MENFGREILAVYLFKERPGRALKSAPVAEAAEGAGARAEMERARKRRERVARFLKALAMCIAPAVGPEARHASRLTART